MTETSEMTQPAIQTTTVTVTRGISTLLMPSITQLSNPIGDCPSIVQAELHKIVIAGLPTVSAHNIYDTAIIAICHDLQHLYRDGDCVGHTGIKEKRAEKRPLCNNKIRIAFSYSASYKDGLFAITLVPNNAEIPVKLRKIDPSVALKKHVKPKYLRKYGDDVYLAIPMVEAEAKIYMNLFSIQCAQEIQNHIDRVFLAASHAEHKTGKKVEPDYYNKENLRKTYLNAEIAD